MLDSFACGRKGVGMDREQHSESVWRRGWNDTKAALHNLWFWGAEAIGGAVVGVIEAWLVPVWIIGVLVAVWVGATASAPVKQRNEARKQLTDIQSASVTDEERQSAIDALSAEIDWATKNILIARPKSLLARKNEVSQWQSKYQDWCERVNGMLSDRRIFTQSDEIHFKILGFVEPVTMPTEGIVSPEVDRTLGQMKEKFKRLREIISWAQQR